MDTPFPTNVKGDVEITLGPLDCVYLKKKNSYDKKYEKMKR